MSRNTKSAYGGFILTFEPVRCERIDAALRFDRREATETFSAADWKFERREIIAVSLSLGEEYGQALEDCRTIDGLALMERTGVSAATGKIKMRILGPVMFERPIHLKDLPRDLSLHDYLSSSVDLKRVLPEAWSELIEAIKAARPNDEGHIDELVKSRLQDRRIFPSSKRAERLMEQRDAIGVAIDIAGLDRRRVLKSLDPSKMETADSALDLLDAEPLHEQDAIRLDQSAFGVLLRSDMRHARFSNSKGAEVRVHVYDKKPIENVLGIDLLIYLSLHQSYILVQYKMMKKSAREEGQWYYPVDQHLLEQMRKMRRVARLIRRKAKVPIPMEHWRLSEELFYWKFCEPTRSSDSEGALVRGITLNLSHLRSFLKSSHGKRKGGGRRIGYGNCYRYLTTSQFTELARDGWIGSGLRGKKFVEELLTANQAGGRETILAVISRAEELEHVRRGWRQ